jgi:hypothetical protein
MNLYRIKYQGFEQKEEDNIVAESMQDALSFFLAGYKLGDSSNVFEIVLVAHNIIHPKRL